MTSLPIPPSGALFSTSQSSRGSVGAPSPSETSGPVEAANGVRHWASGSRPEVERGGDLYELPTSRDGVPQQILIEPRPWWRGGTRVTATDASGHALEATLFPSQVTVIGYASGMKTTLNRESLDLDVAGPRHQSSQLLPTTIEGTVLTDVEEHLAASGDVTIRTHHEVKEMVITGGAAPVAMPGPKMPLSERYEETVIPVLGPITTRYVTICKQEPPVETPLPPARVDESGIILTLADGHEEELALPVPLHAMAR